jgi:hypothetical protein
VTKDLVAEYGHIVVDECHHLSAVTFEQVMRQVKAKYVLGLTATPIRKDGHHPIIYMQCGPIRFNLPVRSQVDSSPFEHRVKPRTTGVRWSREEAPTIQELYGVIAVDAERNSQIVLDVSGQLRMVDRRWCCPGGPIMSNGSVHGCGNIQSGCSC